MGNMKKKNKIFDNKLIKHQILPNKNKTNKLKKKFSLENVTVFVQRLVVIGFRHGVRG